MESRRIFVVIPEARDAWSATVAEPLVLLCRHLKRAEYDVTAVTVRSGQLQGAGRRKFGKPRTGGAEFENTIFIEPDSKYSDDDRFLHRFRSHALYEFLKEADHDGATVLSSEYDGEIYYSIISKFLGDYFQNTVFVAMFFSPLGWVLDRNLRLPRSLTEVESDFMQREILRYADVATAVTGELREWMKDRKWPARELPVLPIDALRLTEAANTTHSAPAQARFEEIVFVGSAGDKLRLNFFAGALARLDMAGRAALRRVTFLVDDEIEPAFLQSLTRRIANETVVVEVVREGDSDRQAEMMAPRNVLGVILCPAEAARRVVVAWLAFGLTFLVPEVDGLDELISPADLPGCRFRPQPVVLARQISRALAGGIAAPQPSPTVLGVPHRAMELIKPARPAVNAPRRPADRSRTPLVSVIITHYERPLLLAEALDSLRAQSYGNFEVIVVDDGSASAPALAYLDALRAEFEERRWTLLRQENAYLGAARNAGARAASGEFLLFMDDDDLAAREEISALVKAAVAAEADILTVVCERFGSERVGRRRMLLPPLGGAVGAGLFVNAFGYSNALWRRETFVRLGGFSEEYGVGHEDHELFAHAVLSGCRMFTVPEVLFRYRVTDGGMVATGSRERNRARGIRPYLHYDPSGLGMALAYSLALHIERPELLLAKDAGLLRSIKAFLPLAVRARFRGARRLLVKAVTMLA